MKQLLSENRRIDPPVEFSKGAHISSCEEYQSLYNRSIEDPDNFWLSEARDLDWFQFPTKGCEYQWEEKSVYHRFFADGSLNVTVNCLDRHLESEKPAIIWQGDEDKEYKVFTYKELHEQVCRFANVLKKMGVQKGDRVCLYLPMIPELAIAMLGCARIGAVHSIVFAGFSSDSLAHRINDSSCRLLVTADVGFRGGKKIPLLEIAEEALKETPSVEQVIVVQRKEGKCSYASWKEEMERASSENSPEKMGAEDPLFILYTSGSTGKPKGVVHTQAGYLLYTSLTHRLIFDIHDKDVYFCTADIGWITGHSYVIYGPLANGATTVVFEGVPTYPDPGRFWQIVEKWKVTAFYTAPTAIRSLICHGEKWPNRYNIDSLRLLGTVGEPINPEAWMWYYTFVGKEKCPVVDTYWQTETGGILLSPLPGASTLKPGSASKPFFGIEPAILRDDGTKCLVNEGGNLCMRRPWPGMARTMFGDHERFVETYFSKYPGYYFTSDSARIDEEGDYFLLGRIDDVINVSGHRIGTAEVESALVSHKVVAEAAVVPVPHPVTGEALFAFITLVDGIKESEALKEDLRAHVKQEIGPIISFEAMKFARQLPKTRSGKIMRRILQKIANNDLTDLGDTSTLADPKVIEELIK